MVQIMLLGEMLLVPIPREVSERVETYAAWLGVGDDMIQVVRRIANGSLGLALIDFERSGYFEQMLAEPPEHLHTSRALDDAWEAACSDDELHAALGRARALPRGLARPGRLALLPRPRLHVPRPPGERAAEPRAARLGPRARRLRLDRRVGDRGVRSDLARQRRPQRVLAPRHGARAVRDRLPLRRREAASSSTTAVTSRATSTAWRSASPTRRTAVRCSPRTSTTPAAVEGHRPPRHRLVRARRPSARRRARRVRPLLLESYPDQHTSAHAILVETRNVPTQVLVDDSKVSQHQEVRVFPKDTLCVKYVCRMTVSHNPQPRLRSSIKPRYDQDARGMVSQLCKGELMDQTRWCVG